MIQPTDGPVPIHAINIQLVQMPDGSVGITVHTGADSIVALGLIEMAKDIIKSQAQQPKSPLVVAQGRVPRVS